MVSSDHQPLRSLSPENPARSDLSGMRVAVVSFSHFPSDPRPRRAAEALAREGMRVEVISLKQNDADPTRESYGDISVLRIPLKHRRGGKFAYLFQYGSFLLISLLLLGFRSLFGRYRLVHVHNMPDVLVFSGLVPKLLGAKVILDLHDPMPELMMTIFNLERTSLAVRLLEWFEQWSIRFADLVLTPNEAFRKLFVARGCPADKLNVVMNTPDEGIFEFRAPTPMRRSAEPGQEFIIMYHGALVERHGLDLAIDALGQMRRSIPGAKLRVFGRSTPFLERTMEEVRKRGLQDAVTHLGSRSLEGIAQAIDECHVGIIPNRRSVFTEINLPTRVFEYLARGKPVIAPRTRGVQDYFGEDELIFCELGSAQDLARKLTSVFAQPIQTMEIVKRGQAVYKTHFWSAERSHFVSITRELLQGVVEAKANLKTSTINTFPTAPLRRSDA